jgi:hypothetical protein
MEVYVSINGVLRNFLQKFTNHYNDNYIECEIVPTKIISSIIPEDLEEGITEQVVEDNGFIYEVKPPIYNGNILDHFTFQSDDEYRYFTYVEFALELFGYAGLSNPTAMSDLNRLIQDNSNVNFTLIGLDEFGKATPSTLFFLSKNACLVKNIRFIKSEDLSEEWNKCDIWITDSQEITKLCPSDKKVVKFNTEYNNDFTINLEINKLTEVDPSWLTYTENIIT